jgi:hypothetical protein
LTLRFGILPAPEGRSFSVLKGKMRRSNAAHHA